MVPADIANTEKARGGWLDVHSIPGLRLATFGSWQREFEGASPVRLAAHADGPAVSLHQHPADVEAQPQSLLLLDAFGPVEALEQVRHILRGYSSTVVDH